MPRVRWSDYYEFHKYKSFIESGYSKAKELLHAKEKSFSFSSPLKKSRTNPGFLYVERVFMEVGSSLRGTCYAIVEGWMRGSKNESGSVIINAVIFVSCSLAFGDCLELFLSSESFLILEQ